MGGSVSVVDPYDYSKSTDQVEEELSTVRLRAMVSQQIAERPDPIRANYLEVPCSNKHPFLDYRFNKKLGEGAFSVVYKGTHVSDENNKVAIKEINSLKLNRRQSVDLHTEMNILSQIRHPSVVRLYSVYAQQEKIFMVMEYLKGGELLNAICKRQCYTEGDARRLLLQITSALQYLHSRSVIHRDIKPENLILENRSFESAVKLVDFGFAAIQTEQIKKPSRYMCGTPGYMAPEVVREKSYSTKVDMWSLGVITYILLSGTMPFSTQNDQQTISGQYAFPESRWRNVSPGAKQLISKLLVVDPEKRFSAEEVLSDPWMLIPIVSSSSRAEEDTDDMMSDVDISDNLDSLRQFNAMRKLNVSVMVLSGVVKFKKAGRAQREKKRQQQLLDEQNGEVSDTEETVAQSKYDLNVDTAGDDDAATLRYASGSPVSSPTQTDAVLAGYIRGDVGNIASLVRKSLVLDADMLPVGPPQRSIARNKSIDGVPEARMSVRKELASD